jgi:hypothetical protein
MSKYAVIVPGPLKVAVVVAEERLLTVMGPWPLTAHVENTYPELADAWIVAGDPALYQPVCWTTEPQVDSPDATWNVM